MNNTPLPKMQRPIDLNDPIERAKFDAAYAKLRKELQPYLDAVDNCERINRNDRDISNNVR